MIVIILFIPVLEGYPQTVMYGFFADSILLSGIEESGGLPADGATEIVELPYTYGSEDFTGSNRGWFMGTVGENNLEQWPGVKCRMRICSDNHWEIRGYMEQDPGEPFKKYPDQLSGGIKFYPSRGVLKQLIIGDYHVNTGLGVTLSTGRRYYFLFQSPELFNRQGRGLSLHPGADENRFFRGSAMELEGHHWSARLFVSGKRVDAVTDTLFSMNNEIPVILNFPESGYHRTDRELASRKVLPEDIIGGDIRFDQRNSSVGISWIRLHYGFIGDPIVRAGAYVRHRMAFGVLSGEGSINRNKNLAWIAGLRSFGFHGFSFAARISYRSDGFHGGYSVFKRDLHPLTALWEYRWSVVYTPGYRSRILAVGDYRYAPQPEAVGGLDRLRLGLALMLPLGDTWQLMVSGRYSGRGTVTGLSGNFLQVSGQVRSHWDVKKNWNIRMDLLLNVQLGNDQIAGTLPNGLSGGTGSFQIRYGNLLKRMVLTTGLRPFVVPDEAPLIYRYEPDLTYAFSVPVFSGSGCRFFLMSQWSLLQSFRIEVKWWHTVYSDLKHRRNLNSDINGLLMKDGFRIQVIKKI